MGCGPGQWQCADGQCISVAGRCDSIPDCDDESDEKECKKQIFIGAAHKREYLVILKNKEPKMKIIELANRVDQVEAAHNEPPHLDLHSLPSGLRIL